MTDLETLAAALAASGGGAVLATLVRVDGSAYRGPGARMVVNADGTTAGAISGGCLEKDVVARAEAVRTAARAALVTWDLTKDDEKPWGLGMGCNATLDVLLEPCPEVPAWLAALREAERLREAVVLATVFAAGAHGCTLGDRVLVSEAAANGARGRAAVHERAARALAGRRTVQEDGVLYEYVPPPLALVVCGDGPDTAPLLALAGALGWQARAVRKDEPLGALDARSAAVVMTHNYARDFDLLAALLPSATGYIGLLGPRARTARILRDLAARGVKPSKAQRARLHAPVGLDIGAESPSEVALAIAAEVRSAFAGRSGGPLRQRAGPIHER